jgi:hypothetical protein
MKKRIFTVTFPCNAQLFPKVLFCQAFKHYVDPVNAKHLQASAFEVFLDIFSFLLTTIRVYPIILASITTCYIVIDAKDNVLEKLL